MQRIDNGNNAQTTLEAAKGEVEMGKAREVSAACLISRNAGGCRW